MAMTGKNRFVYIGHMVHQISNLLSVLLWKTVAGCVWNRQAGFDDIYSQIFEFQGQVQLFGCIEFASRNLLTISEGGVENKNLVVCHSLKKSLKAPERETQSPKLVRCSLVVKTKLGAFY